MSEKAARARIEAQNAAQWLARLARSYAAQRGEIALDWEGASRRILTPPIAPGLRVGLTLPTLVLQFEEQGHPSPHPLDVDDRSSAEVEAWLLIELLHRGLDREAFSKDLPYAWPHPMSGDAAKYAPHDLAEELEGLAQAFETAGAVLADVSRALGQPARPTVSPERFDLGFEETAARGCGTRIGFTTGDARDPRPRYVVGEPPIFEIAADAAPRDAIIERLTEPFGETGHFSPD